MNLKSILTYGGLIVALIALGGSWMVTAAKTEDNRKDIEKTEDKVDDLENIVIEQRTLNVSQQAYNRDIAEILKELKAK